MTNFENYYKQIKDDATMFVEEFEDELLNDIKEGNNAIDFVEDYRLNEWVDTTFARVGFIDSAYIIKRSDHPYDNDILWEGKSPYDAVMIQAYHTYLHDLDIEIINQIIPVLENKTEELESEIDKLMSNEDHTEGDYDKSEDLSEYLTYVEMALDDYYYAQC